MDKTWDPRHLDIRSFAQSGAELQGQAPLPQWPRLLQERFAEGSAESGPVHWRLQGRLQAVTGGSSQVSLSLWAEVALPLQCQRCLMPVVQAVTAERNFLFVADEATAEILDEDCEDDVLVIGRDFDALSLVEDELILALPLVPRHGVCPDAPPQTAVDKGFEAAAADRPHPFAALATLKKHK